MMKIDPKLVKYIQSLGMNFDFEHLTDNDWYMIEEILGESLPVNGCDDEPEDDFFGEDMMDMYF